MCPEDSAHISNGATFFPEKWGKKARQFSSLISEPYKQWSYLRHTDPKAVSGRGYGGIFTGNTSFQEGYAKGGLPLNAECGGELELDGGLATHNTQDHWGREEADITAKAPDEQPLPWTTKK